jgi:hypothetical protein
MIIFLRRTKKMKIIIFEANKEELAANKRVADTIVDTLTTFLDSFTKLSEYSNNDNNNNEEEQ